MILEDCGWGSCLEVVGGAASCSRGGANLDRQDRMHIKRANVFRSQIFKNLNNFFTCKQLYLYGKLFYAV